VKADDPGPLPEVLTRCAYCKMTWPPITPTIGQAMDQTYFGLVMVMCQHLQQKHPQEFAQEFQKQVQVQLRLSHIFYLQHFNSNDPEVARYRDVSRHAIFAMLQKNRISDATIESKVAQLASQFDNSITAPEVINLLKEVRDALEEKGMYPEFNAPDPRRVILASPSRF
jgi:hypothetical protein